MRNANAEELLQITEAMNDLAIKRAEVSLLFAKVRSACGAPDGYVVHEITGEWIKPPQAKS